MNPNQIIFSCGTCQVDAQKKLLLYIDANFEKPQQSKACKWPPELVMTTRPSPVGKFFFKKKFRSE